MPVFSHPTLTETMALKPLCLIGQHALSEFRLRGLEQRLQHAVGQDMTVRARIVHYVELSGSLSGQDQQVLNRLLQTDTGLTPQALPEGADLRLVVPRLGTQSPWSSKATDILNHCGLEQVNRVERGLLYLLNGLPESLNSDTAAAVATLLHDPLTESCLPDLESGLAIFRHPDPAPLERVRIPADATVADIAAALGRENQSLGLALSEEELDYLARSYHELCREPTLAEFMMCAQANSEHCRHKVFNASWTLDGVNQDTTLFDMIRHSSQQSPAGLLSAYHDNAAVIEGQDGYRFHSRPGTGTYGFTAEAVPIQIKVETHNHPTAISPFAGAATGSGGEIRDEAATGRGGKPKAGLTGFSVSDLQIPGFERPWENSLARPQRLASPLPIMLQGPIGAAAFNNEFGRPALGGYFRTFEQQLDGVHWGYHKPIIIAGGYGNIRPGHVEKIRFDAGAPVIVLGGPAMLIGLGGAAGSSMDSGSSSEALDFASVQRGNPEMERRCQEVIDACWSMGEANPILSIHDVGAGGLSNALPELLHDAGRGGQLELRAVANADPGMSPMQIWCNEAQERYVMVVSPDALDSFLALCERERCPVAVVGQSTDDGQLRVDDSLLGEAPVDLPLDVLLGKPPKMHRQAEHRAFFGGDLGAAVTDWVTSIDTVLSHPTVASKSFLITIGDRHVGGLTVRDQMVGPWQVPVADAAITASSFKGRAGEAASMGERSPLAVVNPAAAARMAVGEALSNLASVGLQSLGTVKLSANWMAAAGAEGQDAALFDAVKAVGQDLCPALGIAIPVGKDSLSMQAGWQVNGEEHRVVSPVSLVATAFAPVPDVTVNITPQLQNEPDSRLLLIDPTAGRQRLGGSIFAQCQEKFGDDVPDLDDPAAFRNAWQSLQALLQSGHLLACHDRSDGGLIACLAEMAFAGRLGLTIELPDTWSDPAAALFNEELGWVVQVAADKYEAAAEQLNQAGVVWADLGHPVTQDRLLIRSSGSELIDVPMSGRLAAWSEVSYRMQALRDHPECAREAHEIFCDWNAPGLQPELTFEPPHSSQRPARATGKARPRVAILREQGVNSQLEMAAGFHQAGFEAVDVHMSDLTRSPELLDEYQTLVACGGFSFGDVLGAGRGWAGSILHHRAIRESFERFFHDPDKLALGVCNGCQMFSSLAELVPGADHWPRFVGNRSEQFEARLSQVRIGSSPSVFLRGMQGAVLPIVTAHGEGRTDFSGISTSHEHVVMRYVDGHGQSTERYPHNPNGSEGGITGLCNEDGRITIMMPHPERTLRALNFSWAPPQWQGLSVWQQMFVNAFEWIDQR